MVYTSFILVLYELIERMFQRINNKITRENLSQIQHTQISHIVYSQGLYHSFEAKMVLLVFRMT